MTSLIPSASIDTASAAIIAGIEATARKERTPCGDGTIVWRVWGAGEPLLLLHGGSGSWTHWIRNIPELAQRFEVWVPDIPGLAIRPCPPSPGPRTTSPKSCAQASRLCSRLAGNVTWRASPSGDRWRE
jgi:pimeloyl-ACP methyl ester carboxylesterase